MSLLHPVITLLLGVLIGRAICEDKPAYGIPLIFVAIFHFAASYVP